MKPKIDYYEVGSDDRRELADRVEAVEHYFSMLSATWTSCRADYYEKLPTDLVDLLDAAADSPTCTHDGCRHLIVEDSDFCEEHSR